MEKSLTEQEAWELFLHLFPLDYTSLPCLNLETEVGRKKNRVRYWCAW